MMNRLKQLFFTALAKKEHHFLQFTKDKVALNLYLAEKQEILKDYYMIQNWKLP